MAILREVESAEGNVAHQTGMVRGAIRIGTTSSLVRHFIIPALPRFRERYPNIKIDLHLSDTVVDLVQEGIDCVLRAGEPKPSSLRVRRVGLFQWYICASPDYLEPHGNPASLAELREHVVVGYASSRTTRSMNWTFQEDQEQTSISMKEGLMVNDTDAYIAAGVAGLGLIRAASYVVRTPLTEGRLVRVLAGLETPREPLSILYPRSRHLSPAVRAFKDWCVEVIGKQATQL